MLCIPHVRGPHRTYTVLKLGLLKTQSSGHLRVKIGLQFPSGPGKRIEEPRDGNREGEYCTPTSMIHGLVSTRCDVNRPESRRLGPRSWCDGWGHHPASFLNVLDNSSHVGGGGVQIVSLRHQFGYDIETWYTWYWFKWKRSARSHITRALSCLSFRGHA